MNPRSGTFEEVTGAILIGGQSRRLGRDKVLLSYEGKPLVLHIHRLLNGLFPRTLLIGHPRPELETHGLTCIPDLVPDKGVLGGIYTALNTAATPYVFVTGADMPFLTTSLISEILDHRGNADAVIPRGPRGFEPLCALYSKRCAVPMKNAIDGGTFKIMAALEGLNIITPEITVAEGDQNPFANINYPQDISIIEGDL